MNVFRAILVLAAVGCAVACIYFALVHEPDQETIEFTSEPGQLTSDSLSYCMIFTGDLAEKVEWDFGDGTTAEATEVFKTYDHPGQYSVVCKATNSNGVRVSGYSLNIVESEHGLFDGYGKVLALLILSVILMIVSWMMRGE